MSSVNRISQSNHFLVIYFSHRNTRWSRKFDAQCMIDDSRAKNIFINSTITLKCFVRIELGVMIDISWDVPNKKVSLFS